MLFVAIAMDRSRIVVALPSFFVPEVPRPPSPPPVPGTVKPEDLRPDPDPPRPFLVPWAKFEATPRTTASGVMPCDVNVAMLANFLARHDVETTLEAVFKDRTDRDTLVQHVMASLLNPFRSTDSNIVWNLAPRVQPNPSMDDRLGGKKLRNRHKILRGDPWSIATFVDPDTGVVKRNVVYDDAGDAVAQVDFGHGQSCGIHVHALVQNNLEHTPGNSADHSFALPTVPWPWLCVPWGDRSGRVNSATALPRTVDDVDWVAVQLPFEDFSSMGDAERTDSV